MEYEGKIQRLCCLPGLELVLTCPLLGDLPLASVKVAGLCLLTSVALLPEVFLHLYPE